MSNDPAKKTYEIVFDELGRAIWHCDYYGAYGNHFIGTFVFKPILSVLEEIAVDRLTRQLLGNDALSHIDPVIEKLAYALASLKYRVIKAPPFWMDAKTYSSMVQIPAASSDMEVLYNIPGGHIDDMELIFYVYGAAIEAQLKFKEKIKQKSQQAINVIKKHVDELQQNNINSEEEDKEALEAIMKESNEETAIPKTVTKTYTHLQDEDE